MLFWYPTLCSNSVGLPALQLEHQNAVRKLLQIIEAEALRSGSRDQEIRQRSGEEMASLLVSLFSASVDCSQSVPTTTHEHLTAYVL